MFENKEETYITKVDIKPKEEIPTKPIGKVGEVDVSINLDIVQLLIFGTSIASLIVSYLSKVRIDKTIMSDVLSRLRPSDFKRDKEIEAIMNRMQGLTGASRVVVALFTNGTKAHHFPFRYFSIFWEIVDEGIAVTKYKYQHIPLDKIRDDLELCMESPNKFIWVDKEQSQLKEKCKVYLNSSGIYGLLAQLVGNNKEGYIGIVNLHFERDPHLTKEELDKLDQLFLLLEHKLEAPRT